jgi:hypothetical protein
MNNILTKVITDRAAMIMMAKTAMPVLAIAMEIIW